MTNYRAEDLYKGLMSDPDVIATFIVYNNTAAVVDRLRGLGFIVSSFDNIFDAINQLITSGDTKKLVRALDVPINLPTDGAEGILALRAAQGHATAYAAMNKSGGGKKSVSDGGGGGSPFNNSGGGDGGGLFSIDGQDVTWSNLAQGLLAGFVTMTGGGKPVTQVPAGQMPPANPSGGGSSSMVWWIVGGVALLGVVITIIVVSTRKK